MMLEARGAYDHLPTAIHPDAPDAMMSNDVNSAAINWSLLITRPDRETHPSDPDLPRDLELLTGHQAFDVGPGGFGGRVVANLYGATSSHKSTLAWIETAEINKFPPLNMGIRLTIASNRNK
jgi:hypothetical protein